MDLFRFFYVQNFLVKLKSRLRRPDYFLPVHTKPAVQGGICTAVKKGNLAVRGDVQP